MVHQRRKSGNVDLVVKMTQLFFLLCLFFVSSDAVRAKERIYIDVKSQSACFRNFNATHQVGCASSMKGNVGTVHYVQSEQDIDWIVSKGQHAPYVVVVKAQDFTHDNVQEFKDSGRVNGMMVINRESDLPSAGQSMVDTCPTDRYGHYHNRTEYKDCQKVVWNPPGTGFQFQDFGFPVFSLTDEEDIDNVLNKCFFPFNTGSTNQSRSYPVCAAEIRTVMSGAVDSRTCIRRTNTFQFSLSNHVIYCDPMGGKNVISTMKSPSQKETREKDSVIMVAAKMDSTSLFINDYQAADTTVAALVTMLVTAQALWSVSDDINSDPKAKDIMFAFFQGETFDYIGSKRTVYDMKQKKFPQDVSGTGTFLHPIDLEHIGQILELNQVGHRQFGKTLFAHMDPLAPRPVMEKVNDMVDSLQTFGQANHVDIEPASQTLPLPPASAQTFLSNRLDIPTVVLTDHKDQFTNKYYNSPYDLPKLIKADYPENMTQQEMYDYITPQAELIANLSSTLARYLYKASTGKNLTSLVLANLTGDAQMASHLLYCFTISPNCPIVLASLDQAKADVAKQAKQPYPFYVGVDSHTNEVTVLVYHLMARFTGKMVPSEESCKSADDTDKRYSYTSVLGYNSTGECYKSTVEYTSAKSPAFELEGYDWTSGEYPTWTESRWQSDAMTIRLFLVPSQEFQMSILMVGLLIFVVSCALVYFINSQSHILFDPRLSLQQGQGIYNPMT